jgi:uncharacterized UPF0160 family protein
MSSDKKKKTVVITHNSRFHADDVFAVACVSIIEGDLQIIRTRNSEIFKTGDYLIDIGGEYNPEKRYFDHHQKNGTGTHDSGVPYASFGLIWKEYGEKLCGTKEAASVIEKKLVEPIDSIDNGIPICSSFHRIYPYSIQDTIFSFTATWKEKDFDFDSVFLDIVELAKKVLSREIKIAKDTIEGLKIFEDIYNKTKDKRILEMGTHYPYKDVMNKYPEVLFVVCPNPQSIEWKIEAVTENVREFAPRKMFPENWAGKRDKELSEITGVSDAVFCHSARFLAIAKTREGALKLAHKALLQD